MLVKIHHEPDGAGNVFELREDLEITFVLPPLELVLPFGDGSLRARLLGDRVLAMENRNAPYTFFPDLVRE